MLEEYIPLMFMIIIGFGFAVVFMMASEWLGARRQTYGKGTTYESGMVPKGSARDRFTIKFYLVAVSFIVFDLEVVFLYPWAVQAIELGTGAFIAVLIFISVLLAGLVYEIKKGGLDWD